MTRLRPYHKNLKKMKKNWRHSTRFRGTKVQVIIFLKKNKGIFLSDTFQYSTDVTYFAYYKFARIKSLTMVKFALSQGKIENSMFWLWLKSVE